MSIRIGNILGARGWIGLAAWLLASAGVYVGLIHPSWSLYSEHDQAYAAAEKAAQKLAGLRSQYDKTQQQIVDSQTRLKELGGTPPPTGEQDLQIARITALANACQLTVDQYVPIGNVDEEDHRAVFLQFTARGEFAAIQNFFRRMEAQIDFVDVTHFAMTPMQRDGRAICQVSWSCRINGMRNDPPPATRPGTVEPDPPAAEVVLREP